MKKATIFLFLLAMICGCALQATAETKTIGISIKLNRRDSLTIPSKTDEIKLKRMQFKPSFNAPLSQAITHVLTEIEEKDADHLVFVLTIMPSKQAGKTNVVIFSQDILQFNTDIRKQLVGDLCVGEAHFVVMENPSNQQLIKNAFEKADGDTKFIREYEYVEDMETDTYTGFTSTWDGTKFNTSNYVIMNEDQLKPKTANK